MRLGAYRQAGSLRVAALAVLCMAAGWIGGTHGLSVGDSDGLIVSDSGPRAGRLIGLDLAPAPRLAQGPEPQEAERAGARAAGLADRALAPVRRAPPLPNAETAQVLGDPGIAAAIRAGYGGGQPNTLADFVRGYRDAGGRPAWEERFVSVVIPCESGWRLDPLGFYLGLAQWHPDTWERAGGGDYRDPWQQGHNVAAWSNIVDPASTGGWQGCWSG